MNDDDLIIITLTGCDGFYSISPLTASVDTIYRQPFHQEPVIPTVLLAAVQCTAPCN